MINLAWRAIIPGLSLSAALGVFVNSAMASSYIVPPGTYELTVNGTYGGTGGGAGPEQYYSADFAKSDIENNGNGTTYGFYFTISTGTDYLNVSEGSTGKIEGFYITTETYTSGTPPSITAASTVGPLLYNDTDGFSLSFAAAGNYYVTINLLCGDQSACTTAEDPSNDISLTSSADYEPGVALTPLPAALPMMASGLGLLGFLSRRWKRKALGVAA